MSTTLNGQALTSEETQRLRHAQATYADPHTGRNIAQALDHLRATGWYSKAKDDQRANKEAATRWRYESRATQAAFEPRSPYYIRTAAHRTAAERLRAEVAVDGFPDIQRARRRSGRYSLSRWDPDVIDLHDEVFETPWRKV